MEMTKMDSLRPVIMSMSFVSWRNQWHQVLQLAFRLVAPYGVLRVGWLMRFGKCHVDKIFKVDKADYKFEEVSFGMPRLQRSGHRT